MSDVTPPINQGQMYPFPQLIINLWNTTTLSEFHI